jgi:ubiquinone/menaquinone biosynthesis C-methylase UbiE
MGETTLTGHDSPTPAQAYQQYFGPAIFERLAPVLVAHAAPEPGEEVLDLACGTGIVARRAASSVGPAGRVVGVDINPGMIDVARAQPAPAAPATWLVGDASGLDLPDRSFDLVLCQQGLQFFPDRLAGAREMRRVLRQGGRAAVAVWQGVDRHPLYRALADAEVPHLGKLGVDLTLEEVTAPFSFGDAGELRALLGDAGFDAVEVTAHSIEARFPTPERFVERMEYAYAAVVPRLAADPDAFAEFVEAVSRDTAAIVDRYRERDAVVVPMHTHIAVARIR